MLSLLFSLILNLFFVSALHAACGSDADLQNKIFELKVEVGCAGAESVHTCQKLIKEGAHISAHKVEDQSCEAEHLETYPISFTSRLLAKEVKDALQARGSRLVVSIEEFHEHTRLHRERVKALGLELFKSHPEHFKGLTLKQISSVLEAHDKAKMTAESLGPDGKPFYRTLYEQGYGKKLDRSVVDVLNAKDKEFMEKALANNGITTPDLKAKMERIEKIADFVDRGMSSVSPEEFGRPMEKASSFMKDEQDKKFAAELEKKYKKITSHLSYQTLSPFQQKAIAHQLSVEEKFAEARRSGDPSKLSARMLSHKLLRSGSRAFASFLDVLGSKAVSKALMVLDFPMLYFASMDSIGCSSMTGYHDWVKDPNCSPAIGLTPKVVDFLNEDWGRQKYHLDYDAHTCKVLNETHNESMTAPKVHSCANGEVTMELQGGDRFKVKMNNDKLQEIELMDLSSNAPGPGKPERVTIGEDGKVSKVCYMAQSRGGPQRKCYFRGDAQILKMNEFIRSLNFQIQKGVACCSPHSTHFRCQ